MKTTVK